MSDETPAACAFGTPWADHAPLTLPLFSCAACREETIRMRAEFRARVAAGEYDAHGYTRGEAKHSRRPWAAGGPCRGE